MTSLVFCGDDSGSHATSNSPVFVVSGYLCHVENWDKVKSDWDYVLNTEPRIDYFKMRECYRLKRQFKGWKREDADAKLAELVSVVNHYGPTLIELGGVVDWKDFRQTVTGPLHDYMGSPYYFCLLSIVVAATERVKKFADLGNSIAFVFDEQGDLEQHATKHFYHVKSVVEPEAAAWMASISFGDDKRFSPLQVADLIAWQVRRFHARVREDQGQTRPEFIKLRERISERVCYQWAKHELAEAARKAFEILSSASSSSPILDQ